jgi:hypothetical protein
MKDYLFYDGYSSIRLLDPCLDLRAIGTEDDPLHPMTAAYNRIAAATAKINDRMREQEVESKRKRESVGEGGQSLPDARHGRLDSSSSASPSLRG